MGKQAHMIPSLISVWIQRPAGRIDPWWNKSCKCLVSRCELDIVHKVATYRSHRSYLIGQGMVCGLHRLCIRYEQVKHVLAATSIVTR